MKVLKRSSRPAPKVSFVLLDWSVRESFHLLHYLSRQTVGRDLFEVNVIEYYSRESAALQTFESEVDTWALLEMPEACYYHKHLMYNAGLVLARGEILVFCDSDAMVRERFVETIVAAFDRDPDIVLHLDQFRNMRRDFYPFNYPSFDEVLGPGCINNVDGRTKGVADPVDPLHEPNYGACMCARKADLIAIGGADEHIDYLGHICGPYDMTFRLVNFGRREVWHDSEFLYHTWHPGQAGVGNYLGPHDGRHMSTTALEALVTGRVRPHVENDAIRLLRLGMLPDMNVLDASLFREPNRRLWSKGGDDLKRAASSQVPHKITIYKGFRIERGSDHYVARLMVDREQSGTVVEPDLVFESSSLEALKGRIDAATGGVLRVATLIASVYVLMWRTLSSAATMLRRGATSSVTSVIKAWRFLAGAIRRARRQMSIHSVVRTLSELYSWTTYALSRAPRYTVRRIRAILLTLVRAVRAPRPASRLWIGLTRMVSKQAVRVVVLASRVARSCRSTFWRIGDRVTRLLMERNALAGALGSLVINLYHVKKDRSSDRPPLVITDSAAFAYYLTALSAVGFLPRFKIARFRACQEIEPWIESLPDSATGGTGVIAERYLYLRHHRALASLHDKYSLSVV